MSDTIPHHKWQRKISGQETGERTKCLSPTGNHLFFYFGLRNRLLLGTFSIFLNTWRTNLDPFLTLNGPERKRTHPLQNLSNGLHSVDHKNTTSIKHNLQRIAFSIKKYQPCFIILKKYIYNCLYKYMDKIKDPCSPYAALLQIPLVHGLPGLTG